MKLALYIARSLGIMLLGLVAVVAIFMPVTTSENPWLSWGTTLVSALLFLLLAYMEGAARGEAESAYAERVNKRKQNGETDLSDVRPDKCFSVAKGITCSSVIAALLLLLATCAVVIPPPAPYYATVMEDPYATPTPSLRIGQTPEPTPSLAPGETPLPQPGDQVLITPQSGAELAIRLIHAPYIKLITTFEEMAAVRRLLYFVFCFPYPIALLVGYLMGPKNRMRVHKAIENNDINYRKKQKYMRKRKQMFR